MKIKVFQKGFNYSQDGAGNRLVYHLQGCNMHCPWCANPEGIAPNGTLMVDEPYLIDTICPLKAIYQKKINRSICNVCELKECITLHRTRGIRLSYKFYEADEIIEEAKRSTPLFYDGGGVTFSGGEATLQFEALKLILKSLKASGIHTAIETNATHPNLESLFPFIDQLIMDFKHYNEAKHRQVTGLSNHMIKENIKKALSLHPSVLIRIPLIKDFNDAKKDAENFASFFKQYQTQRVSFECLPYHEYGKVKWQQCGMAYTMQDAYIDTKTRILYEEVFKNNDLLMIQT
ncbi:glycyl-radical enzyme activating protein [Cellulosilyticum sp. I15G10I2]|uniref:glycyl-radical enzyme activating protein n=1 Tax=Cellulosilyticum sp. I15G10I2 TaxID=1892843 RepID=UPI000ABFC6F9|nr:glycyl-radical enzyme activating protein [Cellulosilyticum sp. I15G10I2]